MIGAAAQATVAGSNFATLFDAQKPAAATESFENSRKPTSPDSCKYVNEKLGKSVVRCGQGDLGGLYVRHLYMDAYTRRITSLLL